MIFEEELENENTYAKKKYPENRNIRKIMKNRERIKKKKRKGEEKKWVKNKKEENQ